MNSCKYKLVDIGANLTHPKYAKDVAAVLERAKQAGLVKMMLTGTCVKSSRESLKMAEEDKDNFLYTTAGVHPHDAKTFTAGQLSELKELQSHSRCVAVGECGLDYNRMFSPQQVQLDVFEQQLQLACELDKPLFIHERDAHEDMLRLLDKYAGRLPPAVIHCFTGTAAQAAQYIQRGCYIGLTGYLWKDRSAEGVQHALRTGMIAPEHLLLETDAPFMYPNVAQRKCKLPADVLAGVSEHSWHYLRQHCSFDRNEPCSLPTTADLIAGFMGIDVERLCQQTTANAFKVYSPLADA